MTRSKTTSVAWHALLVGIDDYADDRLDVRGGVADVRAWWQTVRRLGIPAERVVVATSPKIGAGQLGEAAAGVTFFAADRAGLEAARGELATRLGGGAGRALLTWTGHATASADGARRGTLLAASDSDPADAATLLPLLDVVGGLDAAIYGGEQDPAGADAGVVAFIDVCHASAPAVDVGGADSLSTRGALALTATRAGEEAHVIEIGGERRGAFSWAVCTLLDRFGAEGGASRLTAADLYYRAREMLDVIDVRQRPTLFSVTGELDRRLLHGIDAGVLGAGEAAAGDPLEIYPDIGGRNVAEFTIASMDNTSTYGFLYVTGPDAKANGWAGSREYWNWSASHGFDGKPTQFRLYHNVTNPDTAVAKPPASALVEFERVALTMSKGITVSGPYYRVTEESLGGTLLGYVKPGKGRLEIFSVGRASIAASTTTKLVFERVEDGKTQPLDLYVGTDGPQ